MKILLLPGMDGTGLLFERLVAALPSGLEPIVVAYPRDQVRSYAELLPLVYAAAPPGPHLVLAESFSGPLGVLYAADAPPGLLGLILCASFVRSPAPGPLLALGKALARLSPGAPPGAVVRALLTGMDAPAGLVREVRLAIDSVNNAVMAARIAEVGRVDVRDALASIQVPTWAIQAERDRLVGSDAMASLQTSLESVVVHRVASAHLVAQREPGQVAAVIQALQAGSGR